jgi:hypothetical protein
MVGTDPLALLAVLTVRAGRWAFVQVDGAITTPNPLGARSNNQRPTDDAPRI